MKGKAVWLLPLLLLPALLTGCSAAEDDNAVLVSADET